MVRSLTIKFLMSNLSYNLSILTLNLLNQHYPTRYICKCQCKKVHQHINVCKVGLDFIFLLSRVYVYRFLGFFFFSEVDTQQPHI